MAWYWRCASIAKEFGVLPSAVARDLLEDPDRTSSIAMQFLQYARAKAAFDSGSKGALKEWDGTELLQLVTEIAFERAEAALAAADELNG